MSPRLLKHYKSVFHLFSYPKISHYPPLVGAVISVQGAATAVHLLPGQYPANSNPQLLHDVLTDPSASILISPGFNASLASLPLNFVLSPGIATFPSHFYAGNSSFTSLSSSFFNSSTSLTSKSLALSYNIWIAVQPSSSSPNITNRVIIWDSVPDTSQFPPSIGSGPFTLIDMQSSRCSPPCSSSGLCTATGTCACAPGFTGASCEACSSGFFGSQCQTCPGGCAQCDDGINGSGRCIKLIVPNDPSTCGCVNGVCGQGGLCICTAGFTKGDNGTQCTKCADGFFLTFTGDCKGDFLLPQTRQVLTMLSSP
jgi:hypothetical protein